MVLKKGNVERIAVTENQIERLRRQGFECVEKAAETPGTENEEPGVTPVDLKSMKAEELKSFARDKGIEGAASLTKEELLAVLKDVV